VCLLRALDSNEAATGADSAPADLAACSGVTDLLDATACELITISNPVPTCTRSATDCAALDASGCSANTDCSLEAATCVLNQGTLDTCADLNSDAVACNAHDSCTYDGTLSTCGMTTSLETCTAEAASGEAACTGAGTVAGDCDYEAEVCQPTTTAETCAAHMAAGDPESACTGEAGCTYDAIGSIVPGSPETCTDSIDEVVTDCATPYLEGSWQEPSITCPAWNAATKEGCLLTPATFTATETWTERTWDDLTEEFMAAKPLINSTFPVDPKA
jgi:hypothetical protein